MNANRLKKKKKKAPASSLALSFHHGRIERKAGGLQAGRESSPELNQAAP